MGLYVLTDPELKLFRDIEHGDPVRLAAEDEIRAEILRHIIIGLPVVAEEGSVDTAATPPAPSRGRRCLKTAVGIHIKGGLITGALNLDSATGQEGGPICPLRFEGTCFDSSFSGTHAHFGRLSFAGCRFRSGSLSDETPRAPSIDLSGATIDSDLDLQGIHADRGGPEGAEADRDGVGERADRAGGRSCWIRMVGARIEGKLDLSRARLRAPRDPGARENAASALDLSLAQVNGDVEFLSDGFASGGIIGRGMQVEGDLSMSRAMLDGDLLASRLRCDGDVALGARIAGTVNLEGASIAGSLDIFALKIGKRKDLVLKHGNIGRSLCLAVPTDSPAADSGFELKGEADLRGLTCDTLLDDSGGSWGKPKRIRMNRFVYRQASWHVGTMGKRPGQRIVWDWLYAQQAEGHWLWSWLTFVTRKDLDEEDYWQPWQIRRNWIYRQFDISKEDLISISRHRIDEDEYRPQPFEQAIRVARAEGREGFATHFEMVKQRIEWRLFNRFVRWWLGLIAIVLAAAWLVLDHGRAPGLIVSPAVALSTALALFVTLMMMVGAWRLYGLIDRGITSLSFKRRRFSGGPRGRPLLKRLLRRRRYRRRLISRGILWVAFFTPAALLLALPELRERPFHYIVAFIIFVTIRCLSVFAHAAMRFGFGYLRRPVYAIVTLIGAFLVGWWGVHLANAHHMLVIAAEPVATLVAPEGHRPVTAEPLLMGSESAEGGARFVRDISCAHEISEPLYALDVLIPIVDLQEERRCEIRRVPEPGRRAVVDPGSLSIGGLWQAIPALPLDHHRFWWLMKAIYAIAGWFIVSLSILTFAQVNRMHAEPPTERG